MRLLAEDLIGTLGRQGQDVNTSGYFLTKMLTLEAPDNSSAIRLATSFPGSRRPTLS